MLVGRNENFRVPGMSVSDSIERAVAYAEAGADCLFVPFILDRSAVAELVAPKPVNVVVHDYDDSIRAFAALGVRRCSVGGFRLPATSPSWFLSHSGHEKEFELTTVEALIAESIKFRGVLRLRRLASGCHLRPWPGTIF
jgi:hypothetical protein